MVTDEQVEAALKAYCEARQNQGWGLDKSMKLALEAAEQAAWQTMETCPKEKIVLGVVDGNVRKISWTKTSHLPIEGWNVADQGIEDFELCSPTKWRPLPDPPKEQPK